MTFFPAPSSPGFSVGELGRLEGEESLLADVLMALRQPGTEAAFAAIDAPLLARLNPRPPRQTLPQPMTNRQPAELIGERIQRIAAQDEEHAAVGMADEPTAPGRLAL